MWEVCCKAALGVQPVAKEWDTASGHCRSRKTGLQLLGLKGDEQFVPKSYASFLGITVQDLGFGVWGLGLRIEGLGSRATTGTYDARRLLAALQSMEMLQCTTRQAC